MFPQTTNHADSGLREYVLQKNKVTCKIKIKKNSDKQETSKIMKP